MEDGEHRGFYINNTIPAIQIDLCALFSIRKLDVAPLKSQEDFPGLHPFLLNLSSIQGDV